MYTARLLLAIFGFAVVSGFVGCSKKPAEPDKPEVKMSAEEAKQRLEIVGSLRHLELAVRNYQGFHRKGLPPADGEAQADTPNLTGMSWRVHLLPFVERNDIYEKLRKGEYPLAANVKDMPWNRPDLNKEKVLPFTLSFPGKGREPWHTYYRVFVGPGTPFEPKKGVKLPEPGQKAASPDFPDGVSQTMLVVEAGEPVPWPKPEELVYDPKKPLPKLGGQFTDGFYAVFADGTVRLIPHDTNEKTIRAMITRDGGETIDNLPAPVDLEKLRKSAGVKDEP